MAHSATVNRAARGRGTPRRRPGQRPRLHLGRLAVLALVLIAAAFYVQPLRAFFAQQDRYHHEAATLARARSQQTSLKRQLALLETKAYVAQRARSDGMLVPGGTEVFVVKGLPGREVASSARASAPVTSSISVLDRVEDLWRTLLH